MKHDKSMHSANFKRDYIAGFAVILFLLVVAGEIFVAFWIPYYMQEGSALAFREQRYLMENNFDNLRNIITQTKFKNEIADGELQIVYWNLNRLAPYLRKNSEKLDREEVAELNKDIMDMRSVVNELKDSRQPFSRDVKLKTDGFFEKTGEKL